jgi:hypothetical protein
MLGMKDISLQCCIGSKLQLFIIIGTFLREEISLNVDDIRIAPHLRTRKKVDIK